MRRTFVHISASDGDRRTATCHQQTTERFQSPDRTAFDMEHWRRMTDTTNNTFTRQATCQVVLERLKSADVCCKICHSALYTHAHTHVDKQLMKLSSCAVRVFYLYSSTSNAVLTYNVPTKWRNAFNKYSTDCQSDVLLRL